MQKLYCCDLLQKQIAKSEGVANFIFQTERNQSNPWVWGSVLGLAQSGLCRPPVLWPLKWHLLCRSLWSRQQSKALEQQIFQTSSSALAGFGRTQLVTLREFYPTPSQLYHFSGEKRISVWCLFCKTFPDKVWKSILWEVQVSLWNPGFVQSSEERLSLCSAFLLLKNLKK